MPDFSLLGYGGPLETGGADATASRGTAGATAANDTKTAYTQLIASSAFHATGFLVTVDAALAAGNSLLFDVAVGAAASEQDIVENFAVTPRFSVSQRIYFPLPIPAGSRVSVRHQATSGSVVTYWMVHLIGRPLLSSSPLGRSTTYGANAADSGGVSVDPGGTANTKGSYSEIVASTTNIIKALYVCFSSGDNLSRTDCTWLFDIAVGAGTSEEIILADLFLTIENATDAPTPAPLGPLPYAIPSGSRIAARAMCSIIDAADRLMDVVIVGLD